MDDLLERSPSETTPLLLDLARRQAARRRPADLVAQLDADPFVAFGIHDQRLMHALDGLSLDAAPEFEALQLSPVAPLGACSVLAPTSQDRTLSAHRGTEVVSDPTNVLALECARRLKRDPRTRARLATVHQVVRAQALPPKAGHTQHFRMFALAQAGHGLAEDGFETRAVAEHLSVFDRLFDAADTLDCAFEERRAVVLTPRDGEVLRGRVAEAIAESLPHVVVDEGDLDHDYYDGLRVHFGARGPDGDFVPVTDTGRFDWVRRLTSNRKLRCIASGAGIQLFPVLFGRA